MRIPASFKAAFEGKNSLIIKEIELGYGLLHALTDARLITDEQRQDIEAAATPSKMVSLLLDKLCRADDSKVGEFLTCLEKSNQRHVVDIIVGRDDHVSHDYDIKGSSKSALKFRWCTCKWFAVAALAIIGASGLLFAIIGHAVSGHGKEFDNNGIHYQYRLSKSPSDCLHGYYSLEYCYYDARYESKRWGGICNDTSVGGDLSEDGFCYYSSPAACRFANNFYSGMCYPFVLIRSAKTMHCLNQQNSKCFYARRKMTTPHGYCTTASDHGEDGFCYY